MEIIMNSKLLLTVVALGSLVLFAATVSAQELARPTQELLEELKTLSQDVDAGKVTSENWQQQGRLVRGLIDETLSTDQRNSRIKNDGYTDAGKKALDAAYKSLAKSLAKNGISSDEPMDGVLSLLYAQLKTTIESVRNYRPGDLMMVTGGEAPWLLRAISKKEYARWEHESINDWNVYAPVNKQKFDEAFKELNALAATKIPKFKPHTGNFSQRNADEEALMKKQVPSVSIHKIGLAQSNWDIQKNELDIIQKRFKTGYCWAKDPADDTSYCRLYQINLIQEYLGGGNYSSTEALLVGSWVVGCP